jgi:hypothetical protein
VLVDVEGKVVSQVAVGASVVLEIAAARRTEGSSRAIGGLKERRQRISARSHNSN